MAGYSRLRDCDFAEEVAAAEAEALGRARGVAAAIVEVDGMAARVRGRAGLGHHTDRAYVREAVRIGWELAQTFSPGCAASLKITVPQAVAPHRWIRIVGGSRVWSEYNRTTWLLLGSERLAPGTLRLELVRSVARVEEYREHLPALAPTDDPEIFRLTRRLRRSRTFPLPVRRPKGDRGYDAIRTQKDLYRPAGAIDPDCWGWIDAQEWAEKDPCG